MATKLLWIGNSPSRIGGQNRVTFFMVRELQKMGVEVAVCGQGSQILSEGEQSLCRVFKLDVNNWQATISPAIEEFKPDIILFSHDVWLFYWIHELKAKHPGPRYIGWFTIDAHPIHPSWIPILRAFDYVVTPTRFGKEVIYRSFPEKMVEIIEYGIDKDVYKLPASKREVKRSFGERNKLPQIENKCIFSFAGANQFKKSIGTIVDAFSILNNPHCYLFLALKNVASQTGGYQYAGEYDLPSLVQHPNIGLILQALDDRAHADLFQMTDFLTYPSQGEAPGLQIGEAQLCGALPIVTNYTAMPDECVWDKFLLKEFVLYRGQFNCYRAIVDPRGLARKMQEAFEFWVRMQQGDQLATDEYVNVISTAYKKFEKRTWINAATQFMDLFSVALDRGYRVDSELNKL